MRKDGRSDTQDNRPRVTIRSIAAAAGVSPMTVSLALRNRPEVADETGQAIRALAEAMGYQRNPMVSAWMRQVRSQKRRPFRGDVIAFVLADDPTKRRKSHWLVKQWEGAHAEAKRLGYRLEDFLITRYRCDWNRLRKVFTNRGIRGVVFAPMATDSKAIRVENLDFEAFSVTSVEELEGAPPVPFTLSDHYAGMRLAIHEAQRQGARRIGFARHLSEIPFHDRWHGAYLEFQASIPARRRVPTLKWSPEPPTPPYQDARFRRWFRRYRPDAVIGALFHIPSLLEKMKVAVPDECRIYHLEWKSHEPHIPGVEQHLEEIGARAVRLVADRLERNETGAIQHPISTLVSPTWNPGIAQLASPGQKALH